MINIDQFEYILFDLLNQGVVRDVIWHDDFHGRGRELQVQFLDGWRGSWRVTAEEIANGDSNCWIAIIERDIARIAREHSRRPVRYSDHVRFRIEGARLQQHQRTFYQTWEAWEAAFTSKALFTPEAEEKAEALFRKIAGDKAWRLLKDKHPCPVKGSLGTNYHLHNTKTYCVTRLKDKAKLCAVVKEVPLWDHLLGIKLIIEQDEPRFLKTANVSPGYSYFEETVCFDPHVWGHTT